MDKGRFCRRYSSHAFQATARTETPPWRGTASCGFTLVVFEEAPEPFATLYWAFPLWGWADHRKEEHVALALMIPLVMKMCHILRQRMAERPFPEQDQPRETLLLDRPHPALRVGIEIRRPRRQRDSRDPSRVDELLKSGAVFPVPVMDEVVIPAIWTCRLPRWMKNST